MTFSLEQDGRTITGVVLRSLEELAALEDGWRELHASATSESVFLTWEWVYTWSERFVRDDRRLFVVALFDRAELIAIAPWYIRPVSHGPVRVREITFLGLPEAGSDYLEVLSRRGRERQAAQALIALLFGRLSREWDVLGLQDVPADSPFLARFISQLRRSGKHYDIHEGSFCPGVQLPDTFDEYLQQLSSHGRQAYRRKMRALFANDAVQHVVLQGERDTRCALKAFRELYEKRWGRTPVTDDLFALVEGYRARAAEWPIEVSLLRVQDRTVAGLLHFTHQQTMWQYLMAVDRSFNKSLSVGHLICGMSIESAINRGFREYDFLKTEEDYKLQLTDHGRRSVDLRLHNRTVRSLTAWTVRAANDFGKILLR